MWPFSRSVCFTSLNSEWALELPVTVLVCPWHFHHSWKHLLFKVCLLCVFLPVSRAVCEISTQSGLGGLSKGRWSSGSLLGIIPITWILTMLWWSISQLLFSWWIFSWEAEWGMQKALPRAGGRWAAPGLENLTKLFPELHFAQKLPQDCTGLFWGGIFRSGKSNYTALNKSEVRRGQSLVWQGFNLLGVFLQNDTDSFFKIKLLKTRWIGT